jgi:hypothetical protein
MARRDSQRPAFLLRSFLLPANGAKLSRELRPESYVGINSSFVITGWAHGFLT